MSEDEQHAAFEAGLQQLALDVYGIRLTAWVLPHLALNDDMDVIEDISLPESQTLQATAGLLRWAQVNCDHHMIRSFDE